jgi:hypothetical protein
VDPDKFFGLFAGVVRMARKRYAAEQIIGFLRQDEVMVGQGKSIAEVLREIGVTANTYLYFTRLSFVPWGMTCR